MGILVMFGVNIYNWFKITTKDNFEINPLNILMFGVNIYWAYIFANAYYIVKSLEKANEYVKQEKYDEAEKIYLKYIKYQDSVYNLANLYYMQGKCNDAKKYYLMTINSGKIEEESYNKAIYYLAQIYHNNKVDESKKLLLKGIKNKSNICLSRLIEIYHTENKYDKILQLYEKYNEMYMDIDDITISIFDEKIKINDNSKYILKTFEFLENKSILHEHQLEIFKFTMEIPILDIYENNEYDTFKIVKYNIIPYRKFIRVPKYIIIEIVKWLFK